jgi:hypothetical protein
MSWRSYLKIACGAPIVGARAGSDDEQCGAYLPDLENRPPADVPPRPRQRLRVVK